MGRLIYGNGAAGIEFPDRTLAHLQIVILSKLRRAESFSFSFDHGSGADDGQTALWLSPPIPLQFVYMGSRKVPINRDWLELLALSSNSVSGLQVIAEPLPERDAEGQLARLVEATA